MEVRFILNQKQVAVDAAPDAVLMNVLRDLGCKSVKCGCETTNCGLCTVWIDGKSRLSCSVLAAFSVLPAVDWDDSSLPSAPHPVNADAAKIAARMKVSHCFFIELSSFF